MGKISHVLVSVVVGIISLSLSLKIPEINMEKKMKEFFFLFSTI